MGGLMRLCLVGAFSELDFYACFHILFDRRMLDRRQDAQRLPVAGQRHCLPRISTLEDFIVDTAFAVSLAHLNCACRPTRNRRLLFLWMLNLFCKRFSPIRVDADDF